MRKTSQGSVVISAVGIGVILMIIIAAFQTFTSYRIRATTAEGLNLQALAVAEAGMNMIQTELRNNPAFSTHKINADLTWGTEEVNEPTLKAVSDAKNPFTPQAAAANNKGVYKGAMGTTLFKVKCGLIPYKDDKRTAQIDESNCFYKVEALGRVGDIVRRVNAVLFRRYPGREYLMYDGGFLTIVFGLTTGVPKVNTFASGHFYGHEGVEIGAVIMSGGSGNSPGGTKQKFVDVEEIRSGIGGVFIHTPTDFEFRANARTGRPAFNATVSNFSKFQNGGVTFPGNNRANGEVPAEMDKQTIDPIDPAHPEVASYIFDARTPNGQVFLPDINFPRYKDDAQSGGGLVTGTTDYPLPVGFPPSKKSADIAKDKAELIDFGNAATGRAKSNVPAATSGIIYSPNSIVVKGNPDKDLIIVAEGNIYIAGDFNQAGDPNLPEDKYGLAQIYAGNPMDADGVNFDYKKDLLADPGRRLASDVSRLLHKNVTLYAKERIVYDYRDPIDCFENELYPFVKFEIAKAMLNDETRAKMAVLTKRAKSDPANDLSCDSSDTAAGISARLNEKFSKTTEYPVYATVAGSDLEKIASECAKAFEDAPPSGPVKKVTDAKIDELTRKLLDAFHKKYRDEKDFSNAGIIKLLGSLKDRALQANPGAYIYYPEMTMNGMFWSGAKRNQLFYRGPDVAGWFDEIGNKASTVGGDFTAGFEFIQRVYGSEIRLSNNKDISKITGATDGKAVYIPPSRRKIYDPSLPRIDPTNATAKKEFSAFSILSWQDFRATPKEFDDF